MRRASWFEVITMWAGIVIAVLLYLALFAIVMGGAFLIAKAVFE